MPGSERSGFVQEEELRVLPGSHQRAIAALELSQAADPPNLGAELAHDPALAVVQATAIAHEHAAFGGGFEP